MFISSQKNLKISGLTLAVDSLSLWFIGSHESKTILSSNRGENTEPDFVND
jgi:hypothetical protein